MREITITAHFVKFDSYCYNAQTETEREATIQSYILQQDNLKMANVEKYKYFGSCTISTGAN